jgi:hypothetical protein
MDDSTVRWHYRDAGLLWLFVPAYLVHRRGIGRRLSRVDRYRCWLLTAAGAFFSINAVALVLVYDQWIMRLGARVTTPEGSESGSVLPTGRA